MSVTLSNLTCSLSLPVFQCPLPHQFSLYPNSTVCGSDHFPHHLAATENGVKSGSICDPWKPGYCDRRLQWLTDKAFKGAEQAIGVAHNDDRDNMYAKFLAAMGYDWWDDTNTVTKIPEVPTDKIQIVKISFTESYITVRAEDMTAPVMRGVSFSNTPPYDNRPFFAVRVVDVETGHVFVQTFQRRYASENEVLGYWTTYGGVLIPGRGIQIREDQLIPLARLFQGQAIITPFGRRVRLACEYDLPKYALPIGKVNADKMLAQLEKTSKQVSLCERISAAFASFWPF